MSDPATVPDTSRDALQSPQLTLIVPGLIPAPSAETPLEQRFTWQSGEHAERGGMVEAVLGSDEQPACDEPWECVLFQAVGVPVPPAEQLPTARLRWPLDFPETALPQHLVCADPVHLQVDRDSVSLIPPQAMSITMDEATACAESINALLNDDGIELVIATAEQWYLTGSDPAGLKAVPTHAVARRKIHVDFSEDAESVRWRQLSSEMQMLLHSHPVNASRANRGLLPINGLWFCGGEALPESVPPDRPTTVQSNDEEVLALARVLGVATSVFEPDATVQTLDASGPTMGSPGHNCIRVDLSLYRAWLAGEPDVMENARAALIQRVIVPALNQLDSGKVCGIRVEAGEGRRGIAVATYSKRSALSARMGKLLSRIGIASLLQDSER